MTTISCPSCGHSAPAASKFCPECGASFKPGKGNTTKSTGKRDSLIVVAALLVVAGGYFALRKPAPMPEALEQQASSGAQHPPITDESGKSVDMPMLSDLPTDYKGLVNAGNQNMDGGQYPLAAECYRRALALDGSSADVRSDYGACLHGMGLPQRAIDEFRKVLAQDNKHTICNFNLGIVFRETQQLDSARFYWNKYIEMEPQGKAVDAARQFLKEIGE